MHTDHQFGALYGASSKKVHYHHNSCLTWAQSSVVVFQSCSQDGGSRSALQAGELSTLRVMAPWLDLVVHHLGLALGGRPAASFARRLMLPMSNDTLLRLVRRCGCPPFAAPSVIGIDNWARRRNQHQAKTGDASPAHAPSSRPSSTASPRTGRHQHRDHNVLVQRTDRGPDHQALVNYFTSDPVKKV